MKRTPLARKTELRRSQPIPSASPEPRARVASPKRRRDTGPTPAQRTLVAERAAYACEVCGRRLHDGNGWTAAHSFHHRQARGAGGSSRPETNSPTNLLLVCGTGTTHCHGFIESHRALAEADGWLVRHGIDPADVPVTVDRCGEPVLLTADGDYQPAPTDTEETR